MKSHAQKGELSNRSAPCANTNLHETPATDAELNKKERSFYNSQKQIHRKNRLDAKASLILKSEPA